MKDVFLVYDKSCFYEIVILNYFMSFSNCDMVFCSLDGKPVRTMEGFSVNVDMPLEALEKDQIRSFILPGGNIAEIDTPEVKSYLQALMKREILIAGICAGVDVLDHAGILCDMKSTHSSDDDWVTDKNVITARANAYVDFAVEVAKKLDLFASEDDLQETINFWNIIKECSSTEVAVEYLRQITEDNFMEAFNLKLANGQERFVSHPIRSLAQAYVYRNQCQLFGIYKDDTMIGYVMVIYDYDIPEYDIWHMMTDESNQGQGYGSKFELSNGTICMYCE